MLICVYFHNKHLTNMLLTITVISRSTSLIFPSSYKQPLPVNSGYQSVDGEPNVPASGLRRRRQNQMFTLGRTSQDCKPCRLQICSHIHILFPHFDTLNMLCYQTYYLTKSSYYWRRLTTT